ncbi:VOC family protein [Amycolatopsis benzoatilytica]|uniref:VOC family protein n=1 Tax=Amycolatopsis benzoatilytica TaxID=346045 RepID=UPI00037E6432|nr:VOC family protein [Amycolatopsis benzoatilytica]
MAHPVVHFEIGIRDSEKSIAFYRDLFGWDVQDAGPDYWLVSPGNGGIGGGLMRGREDIPPYVTVYVAVDDLQPSLDRVVELGGEVLVGPTPIPDMGSFALFRDPDGNVIGIIQQ